MSTPLTGEQLAEIKARADAAEAEVFGIAEGKRDWTMRIPAREDTDSDLVIGSALADVDTLLAEVQRLKTRLAAAEMACLAFGAMGGRMETEREKAAYELWWEWTQLEPRPDSSSTGPLTDDLIEELARRRDAKRDTVTQFLAELGGEPS